MNVKSHISTLSFGSVSNLIKFPPRLLSSTEYSLEEQKIINSIANDFRQVNFLNVLLIGISDFVCLKMSW